MYETYWVVLVALGVLTTAVALWGPDPVVTVYAAIFNIAIWIGVGNGATQLVVVSGGVEVGAYTSVPVQMIAFANAFATLVPLFVGLYEWAAGDSKQDEGLLDSDTAQQIQEFQQP